MAGGIDWFRWHHGTVTDQKFPLIAKRSGASVAEVIAVWACLLEAASMNENERGLIGSEPDFESMDCALGMDEGKAQAIYSAMTGRGLIDGHRQITAWPKRQPKREREDTTAADRKRAQREREAFAGVTDGDEPRGAKDNHVTPRHATSHQKTPRGEERREEKEQEQDPPSSGLPVSPPSAEPVYPPTFDGRNAEALNGKAVVPIAAGWELPEQWGNDAEALGWKPPEVLREAERFRQYWVSGKGSGKRRSVKGWRQAWSNWLGRAAQDQR